jgi:hypothetical protein
LEICMCLSSHTHPLTSISLGPTKDVISFAQKMKTKFAWQLHLLFWTGSSFPLPTTYTKIKTHPRKIHPGIKALLNH